MADALSTGWVGLRVMVVLEVEMSFLADECGRPIGGVKERGDWDAVVRGSSFCMLLRGLGLLFGFVVLCCGSV